MIPIDRRTGQSKFSFSSPQAISAPDAPRPTGPPVGYVDVCLWDRYPEKDHADLSLPAKVQRAVRDLVFAIVITLLAVCLM